MNMYHKSECTKDIISSVSLSRWSITTTNLAYYDIECNVIYYYTFRDCNFYSTLSSLILEEKITMLVVQKDLKNLICCLKKYIKLVSVDRKNYCTSSLIQIDDYYSNCTINCLINYLDLDHSTLRNIQIIRKYPKKFMFISEKVIKELNLVGPGSSSFFNLVDQTKTKYGSSKLKINILQPFVDEDSIKERQENILHYTKNLLMITKLESILKDIPYVLNTLIDANFSKDTIEGLKRYAGDCKKLFVFINQCGMLKNLLKPDLNIFRTFLKAYDESKIEDIKSKFSLVFGSSGIKTGLDDYLDLARKIHNELLDDINKMADTFLIKQELKIVKTSKGVCFKVMNNYLLDNPEMIQDIKRNNFETNVSADAFQYSVMTDFFDTSQKVESVIDKMMKNRDEEKHVDTRLLLLAKNKTYSLVVTPEIYKLNLLFCSIKNQIDEIEGEMSLKLLNSIKDDLGSLVSICESIAEIDISFSAYKFSLKYDCCIPGFSEIICVSNSFYPPLKSSIFNDYYSDQSSLLSVITGPNMSGKSTYLKQLAYLTILFQIGYPITAKFAMMKIYKSLYIGFNSTRIDFKELCTLLSYSSPSTLIMIDEPGKGYDTNVLMSFYTVFFRKILESKSTVFFITHHHKIISLLDTTSLNLLNVYKYKVYFGISKNKTGMQICEENLPKIYIDWNDKQIKTIFKYGI